MRTGWLKNVTKEKTITVLSFGLLISLYQNFYVLNLSVKPVNKESRRSHAQELLGKYYVGSGAQLAENVDDLNRSIYTGFAEGLPEKFKSQAAAVTQAIIEDSEFYDIDPVFIMAVIKTESSFNPLARGKFGEIGLMQIKPDTAQWIAKKEGLHWGGNSSLENPVENVKIGIAYVNYLRNSFAGHSNKYLSAYNMGAANVRKAYSNEIKPREYTTRVMRNYKELYSKMVSLKNLNLAGN
jgi:soluble lytic murein transglycosylase